MRRVLMVAVVLCQLLAGAQVSFAAVHDSAVQDGGMDMTHCPDHATHQDHSGKHGCCTDDGCQCAASAAMAAASPPVIYRLLAPRIAAESPMPAATLRIDLFLRPPIA